MRAPACPDVSAAGASCTNGSSFVPIVPDSRWSISDGVWVLFSCPAGYNLGSQQCTLCPAGSYSLLPSTRASVSSGVVSSCVNCPAGGDCIKGGADVHFQVGSWKPINGVYHLISCPAGYQLVNSTDGTSKGTFSPDLQQCKACLPGQYIIDPDTDACQPCPPGTCLLYTSPSPRD